jgi:iron(III) transport system ATP-binding protein
VLLLDEPFSHLDAALRSGTRDEVRRILKESGATTVLVTHDQDEAMTFADRLAVMRAGRIEQLGAPEDTYVNPGTAFVAGFLGRTNLLRGEASGSTVETPLGVLALSRPAKGPVLVSVRPEALRLDPPSGAGADPLVVQVVDRAFHGHDVVMRCRPKDGGPADTTWIVRALPDQAHRVGDVAALTVDGPAVPLERSAHGLGPDGSSVATSGVELDPPVR